MDFDDANRRTLRFRDASIEDSRMIWEWANDPATRLASFSSESIPWEQHRNWFTAKLVDPCCLFFIVLSPDDLPIGQIRFQLDGKEAVISVSMDASQRGKGYGSQAVRAVSESVFATTAVEIIHAYIKPENLFSIRAFTKAGFQEVGFAEIQGNLARDYTLKRDVYGTQLSAL